MKYQKSKPKIINEITKFWFSRGIRFGEIIHDLKPRSINEWHNHLVSHKFYFPKGIISKRYERKYWIFYIKYSIWKLYSTETKAIIFFKTKYDIILIRSERKLDSKFGIDYIISPGNYLIVKSDLTNNSFETLINYKDLSSFNLGRIWIYIASDDKLYRLINNKQIIESPFTNA